MTCAEYFFICTNMLYSVTYKKNVIQSGTVTSDVSGAIKAARLGRIHFKMDKTSIVHVGLGKVPYCLDPQHKVLFQYDASLRDFILLIWLQCCLQASFTEESLRENIGAFMNALLLAKPPNLKKGKCLMFC